MDKRNEFRFSIQLDETDESHRKVAAYLNSFGRKKGRIIAKALLAYMNMEQENIEAAEKLGRVVSQNEEPREETGRDKFKKLVTLDVEDYSFDQAELDLMRRNYDKMGSSD